MADDPQRYRRDYDDRDRDEQRRRAGGQDVGPGRDYGYPGAGGSGDRDAGRERFQRDDSGRFGGRDDDRPGGGVTRDYARDFERDVRSGGYDRGMDQGSGGGARDEGGRGGYGGGAQGYGSRGGYGSQGTNERSYGGGQGYGGRGGEREEPNVTGYRGERGFMERAGDEMASWFGGDEASRRREQDAQRGDGGAQHHRGRGPQGYRRSDERIRDDVSDRLTDDPYVDASNVTVNVSGSEVTLEGTVDSRMARRRAEDVSESVSGVTHVQNNLRVRQGEAGMGAGAGTGSGMASGMVGGMASHSGTSGSTTGTGAGMGSSGATATDAPGLGTTGSTGLGASGTTDTKR